MAVESQQVNSKMFKYPPQGFVTPIEHTLLYTMIRESSIFPPETVLEAVDNEDYTQYFHVNEEKKFSGGSQDDHHRQSSNSTTATAHNNIKSVEIVIFFIFKKFKI